MKFLKLYRIVFLLLVGVLVSSPLSFANAQDVEVQPVQSSPSDYKSTDSQNVPLEVRILKSIEREIKKKRGKDIYVRSPIPSLVFTSSQYALLREARIGFNTRAPTLQEFAKAGNPDDPNYRPPVAFRDIRLGGISFNNPDDWTIWLNGSRVTPDALPAEAIDLRVYKDFVELKWFDTLTNQIYPVRLRINQKFNIDTRIFLPE